MKAKIIITILVIAAVPAYALAQKQETAALKAHAQEIVEMISSDKEKSKVYCEIVKLGNQIEDAVQDNDADRAGKSSLQIDALEKTLGPDYNVLMDDLQDIDPHSEVAAEIGLMFASLEKSCAK